MPHSEDFSALQAGQGDVEAHFDAAWYASRYPDVSGSGLSPLEHYTTIGRRLGREANSKRDLSGAIGTYGLSHAAHGKIADGPPVKVSVLCLTYNHEAYIEETIAGFLKQDVNFSVEFLIADDCSNDRTPSIVAAAAARDNRIRPIYRNSNLGPGRNFAELAACARGEYVALCEGDDYWTDPSKLRLQVEFLDENRDHSICFHPVLVLHQNSPEKNYVFPAREDGPSLPQLVRANAIQTNSVMYRWRFPGGFPADYDPEVIPQDWHLHLLHAEVGKIGFIPEVMAVYRRHEQGMWATSHPHRRIEHRRKYGNGELAFFHDLARRFGGFYSRFYRSTGESVFHELAEEMLERGQYDAMYELCRRHPDFLPGAISKMGFDPNRLSFDSSPDFEASLRAQTKISVIVLTYNQASTIERCIRSILMQNGSFDLEIIVGDDASLDDTASIVERLVSCSNNICLLRSQANLGMLSNMKRCVEACTGNYIAFCEGDDYWLSTWKLWKQLRYLRTQKVGMCFNWVLLEYPETGVFLPHVEQSRISGSRVSFSDLASTPLTANFSCCFYSADAVRSVPVSFYEVDWAADWLFNLYVTSRMPAAFCRELLSVYCVHENGQWSGLTQREQERRKQEAREYFQLAFGRGSGVDGSGVRFRIKFLPSPRRDRDFKAKLEFPTDGSTAFLENGCFSLRGWVVNVLGKHCEIVVRTGDKVAQFSLNKDRPDVTVALANMGETWHRPDKCGFVEYVEYFGRPCRYHLGIRVEGRVEWWAEIEGELADVC